MQEAMDWPSFAGTEAAMLELPTIAMLTLGKKALQQHLRWKERVFARGRVRRDVSVLVERLGHSTLTGPQGVQKKRRGEARGEVVVAVRGLE